MPSLGIPVPHLPLYTAFSDRVVLIDVPPVRVLIGEGAGDLRRGPRRPEIVEALYALSFALSDRLAEEQGFDYGVTPVEALWVHSNGRAFDGKDRLYRGWRYLIVQPPDVTEELMIEERERLLRRREIPGLQTLRLETLIERTSAQILREGDEDGSRIRAIEKLFLYAGSEGYEQSGLYHEIYLTGARGSPGRRRIISRLPVQAPD